MGGYATKQEVEDKEIRSEKRTERKTKRKEKRKKKKQNTRIFLAGEGRESGSTISMLFEHVLFLCAGKHFVVLQFFWWVDAVML